jgi:hypothetical protein
MKTKKSRVTLKQKKLAQKVFQDPLLFATNILGANLWEREVEILHSIQHHRRTAIKACHGVGKTFTLAHAVLWWLARYDDGIVLTTAPTKRQVETQLWSEIHRVAARLERSFPEINLTQLKFRGEHNFALGLSTNRADNFQGYHGSARSRRPGSGSIQEAPGSQPAAGVHEPATAVFGRPGSLQQRALLGAQARAVRSSSKTDESAVCKTLPEKR